MQPQKAIGSVLQPLPMGHHELLQAARAPMELRKRRRAQKAKEHAAIDAEQHPRISRSSEWARSKVEQGKIAPLPIKTGSGALQMPVAQEQTMSAAAAAAAARRAKLAAQTKEPAGASSDAPKADGSGTAL